MRNVLNLFMMLSDMPVGQKRHQKRLTLNDAATVAVVNMYAMGSVSLLFCRYIMISPT